MEKIRGLVKGKKVIVIASTVVAIIVVSVIGVYALLGNKTVLEVKEKTVIYEYGDKVEINVNDLLKTTDKEILNTVKVDNTLVNVDGKDYPKLGTYTITLSYKKEKVTVDVEIKDTKAPTFNTCDIVEFIKGTEFDYASYINATDLQEVTYDFKKETVDINTVGEYTIQIIATDKSNNQATKDIKVKVLDTVDTSTKEVTTTIDKSGNVKTTVTEKPKVETPSIPNTGNATTGNGTTTKPTTPTPSNPKPTTPTPNPSTPPVETPHQHYGSFISPLFDTNEEREQWADAYLQSDENFYNTKYSGYVTSTCSCGKKGVTDFY